MNDIIIVFASATTAARVKKLLLSAGYHAKVIQTPKTLTINGCSYAVLASYDSIDEAKKVAARLNVRIKGIFKFENNQYIPVY